MEVIFVCLLIKVVIKTSLTLRPLTMSSLIIMLHWISRKLLQEQAQCRDWRDTSISITTPSQRCNSPLVPAVLLPRRSFHHQILLCFSSAKIHQPHTLQSWTWCLLLSSLVFHIPWSMSFPPTQQQALLRWGFRHELDSRRRKNLWCGCLRIVSVTID